MQKIETLTLRSADFFLLDNDGELMPEFLYQVMRIWNPILMFSQKLGPLAPCWYIFSLLVTKKTTWGSFIFRDCTYFLTNSFMNPSEVFSADMISCFLRIESFSESLTSLMHCTDLNADEQEPKHSTQLWEWEQDERGREHWTSVCNWRHGQGI